MGSIKIAGKQRWSCVTLLAFYQVKRHFAATDVVRLVVWAQDHFFGTEIYVKLFTSGFLHRKVKKSKKISVVLFNVESESRKIVKYMGHSMPN